MLYAIHSLLTDERKRTPLLSYSSAQVQVVLYCGPTDYLSVERAAATLVDPPFAKENELVANFLFSMFLCEQRLVNFVHVLFFQSFANVILFYECGLCLDKFSQ